MTEALGESGAEVTVILQLVFLDGVLGKFLRLGCAFSGVFMGASDIAF